MAKTKKPTVVRNGSWYKITTADGEETNVQGEAARDEALRDLGHDPEDIETSEDETESESGDETDSTASRPESDESTPTEERYDDPPEPGTEDDRPREAEGDTTPATDPEAAEDAENVGEAAKDFEAGNVSEEAHDAIPAGVRAKQPGAKSTEEQEVEDGERDEEDAFVPEEVRLAQEDDDRREELKDLAPEEAHARQARRATEAGAARTRRPVVPGPKSDTVLPQTGEQKEAPEYLDEDRAHPKTGAEDEPETAIDARGYQTSNDGRGPFSAESLAEGSEAADREREKHERREMLEDMTPEERQEYLVEEAEEAEEDKPEAARKPALRAALDDTVESNIHLRSGIPTGPAHHPESTIRNAPDGTEPGDTLRGWSAQQKTPELIGAGAPASDDDEGTEEGTDEE